MTDAPCRRRAIWAEQSAQLAPKAPPEPPAEPVPVPLTGTATLADWQIEELAELGRVVKRTRVKRVKPCPTG